jgi:Arc/MetJ-type ribon-helix-helix transcriptional regulator
MALVDIDDELKKKVQEAVEKDSVEYPSMKNFVDKAIRKQLERLQKIQDAKDVL